MGVSKSQTVIWAGFLFVGFYALGAFIPWLLPEVFGIAWNRGTVRSWEFPNVFLAIPYALLVVSFLFVRQLDHRMLSHLWLYTIILGTIGLVTAPVLESLHSASTVGWWATAFGLGAFIVLIWLARRISAISFRHALLFVALTTAVPSTASLVPQPIQDAPSLPVHITLWVGGALLGVLAVWILANIHTIAATTRSAIQAVVGMMMLTAALVAISATSFFDPDSVLDLVVPMLISGASTMLAPAVAVLITYAVRVRRPVGADLQPARA